MGTLFEQAERDYKRVHPGDVDVFLDSAVKLAQKYKIDVATVVAAEHVLELRRQNNLYVSNGDVFDEQIAGMGQIAEALTEALLTIGNKLEILKD